ncbi:MAG: AI-2E family transporter [Verrucomicrobia bacterium]|nr:MAG: AI-2E family transporter [Verrucomicrobiota bacterium]
MSQDPQPTNERPLGAPGLPAPQQAGLHEQRGALSWLVTILATCFILFLFQKILLLVVPGLLALALYYCLRPLVQALVRAGLRHRTAVTLLAAQAFVGTLLAVVLLSPLAVARAEVWNTQLVRYVEGGIAFLAATQESLAGRLPMEQRPDWLNHSALELKAITASFAEKYLGTLLLQMVHWLPSLLLMPYLTYFWLQDGNRFKKHLIRSVPNAFFEKTLLLFDQIDRSLQNFLVGLMKLTLLDTVSLGVGLWLLGVSAPLLLGLIAAVLAWVPYVGSVAGCILVVMVAATNFPTTPTITFGCVLLFIGVRLLDDFVFLPMTIGRGLRIHPVLSVLMLFLGAAVAGPTGLVLVLPVCGVVAVVTETVGQIVSDQRLLERFWQARRFRGGLVSKT